MNKVFVVSKQSRYGTIDLHAFTEKSKAANYAIDYIHRNSTLEDQQERIQKEEYSHYTEYYLYTQRYGIITLRVSEITLN